MRASALATLVAALSFSAATGHAQAQTSGSSGFAPLSSVPDNQQVRVLVSGWVPVTGMPVGQSARQQALAAQARRTQEGVAQILSASGGGTIVRHYDYLPIAAVSAPAKSVKALQAFNPRAHITYEQVREPLAGFDANPGALVELNNAGLAKLSGAEPTGKGELVAELDSGVDTSHPYLAGKVAAEVCFSVKCPNGKDFMVGPGAARPLMNHGTHVAGIIAGHNDERSGVAPDARLIAIQVFSKDGDKVTARDSDVLAGLDLIVKVVVEKHVPVASVNMSLGGGGSSTPCADSPFETAAKALVEAGVVVVAAAGNEGKTDMLAEPACAPHIVSVGAVDDKGVVADFSNSAPFLSMLALGVNVVSSVGAPGKIGFQSKDGTSMAAPHVAAAFALLRQEMPKAAPEDLIAKMKADSPRITDPRNNVQTPMLKIAVADTAGPAPAPAPGPAPTPPAPAPTPPQVAQPAPAPAQPGWSSITQ